MHFNHVNLYLQTNMEKIMDEICQKITQIDIQLADLKNQREQLLSDLQKQAQSNIESQLSNNDYGCGTANIDSDNYKIKYTVSKRVKWDQDVLRQSIDKIKASGRNPDDFIRAKYDILETKYKMFAKDVQRFFEPARTVETSKPVIKIEKKES